MFEIISTRILASVRSNYNSSFQILAEIESPGVQTSANLRSGTRNSPNLYSKKNTDMFAACTESALTFLLLNIFSLNGNLMRSFFFIFGIYVKKNVQNKYVYIEKRLRFNF